MLTLVLHVVQMEDLPSHLHQLLSPGTVAGEEAGGAVDVADGVTLAVAVDQLDGVGVVGVDPERQALGG